MVATAARSYENFDLLVEALGDGTFRSRVTTSPVGDGASTTFPAPFDATTLENLLLKLDPGRSLMRRATADPRPKASAQLGGALFDAAFGGEILLAWTRSQDVTRAAGQGLRLRLLLTDAPALAGLPWELLYDRRTNSFPAQSERTPVVRYLEVPEPPRPLAVVGALKILVVLSSPTDLPELDVEAEWRRIQDTLASRVAAGTVEVDRLPAPTVSELAAWLRSHQVHVLHVVGHGDFDETLQEGVLYFCDQYGRSVAVPPAVLGPYLHDHDPLRLVFLNACQTGRLGPADPFSGMAQRLVQQDCTAVVAMQFPVSDGAAVAFTGEFYAALADGMPVDQAVTSARKALLAGFASEWATPVLYLNAPDGQVFGTLPAASPVSSAHGAARASTALPAATAAQGATPGGMLAATVPTAAPAPAAAPAALASLGAPTGPASLAGIRRPSRRPVVIGVAAATLVVAGAAVALSRATSDSSPTGSSSGAPGAAATAGSAAGSGVPASVPAPAPVPSLAPSTTARSVPVQGPALTARRLTTAPTVDGKGDDWPTLSPTIGDYAVAGDAASVKGLWLLGWDTENLYLLAQVVDPTLTTSNAATPSQLFKGDSVTLQFGSPAAPADGLSLSPGDVSLTIGPGDGGTVVASITVGSGARFDADAGRPAPGVKAAVTTSAGGYTVEAAVPWTTIQLPEAGSSVAAYSGARFGANLVANDADPSPGSKTGIRSRVSNNRYVADHTPGDGGYRRYWGMLTLT